MLLANHELDKVNGIVDEQAGRLRCPMCRGRGYFEPTQTNNSHGINEEEAKKSTNASLKLPKLQSRIEVKELPKSWNKFSLPSIKNVKNLPEAKREVRINSGAQWQKRESLKQRSDIIDQVSCDAIAVISSRSPSEVSSIENDPERHLIPSPRTPTNPHESLKSSLTRLKSNAWNESMEALRDIVQISRYHPQILEGSLIIVYRTIILLLKSFRTSVIRTACQAVSELFTNIPNTPRPEFDELVHVLLQKTADMNKFIKQDANEALDSIIVHVPALHSIRTVVQKGMPHKNPLVRAAATRLLVCIVGVTGVAVIYSGHKDTRSRIMNSAVQALQDGCQNVRNYGKRLIKMLMDHEDFEEVIAAEVNATLLRRIEKVLVTIKYQV